MEDRRIAGSAGLGDSLGTRIGDSQSAGLDTSQSAVLGDSQCAALPKSPRGEPSALPSTAKGATPPHMTYPQKSRSGVTA